MVAWPWPRWSHLMKMMPCAGYLTNSSVTAPPSACCDSFSQVSDDSAAICFCHVANGDIQQLLPAPMIFKRMLTVTEQCGVNLRMEASVKHCDEFEGVPSLTLPSPPPSAA